jgi:glycine oxidase
MGSSMHVVVVGAGLVGTAVARALARAGARVTVVERGVPGAEASFAAGGILSPQAECDVDGPMLRLCRRGLGDLRALLPDLCAEASVDAPALGWREGGTLDVAVTADEVAALQRRVDWQTRAGLAAQWLDGDEVRRRAPVGDDVRGAAFFPDEAAVEPRALFEALRASAVGAGVVLRTGQRVVDVDATSVGLAGAAGVTRLGGDAVVVAAGAWTPQVVGAGVGASAIEPVRGVMVEIDGGDVGRAFDTVVYGHGGYAVPRRDGRVLVGSTMERVGFDKGITVAALGTLLGRAAALVPGLATRPVRTQWAGLRPGTVDGLPLLGPSSTGVWIASGHFRNGVLLAAASGELITAALLGGVDVDAAFSPRRFDRTPA